MLIKLLKIMFKKCLNCEELYKIIYKTRPQKFCSRQCATDVNKLKRGKGENSNNWKGGKTKVSCHNCGVDVLKERNSKSKKTFCSKECFKKSDFRRKELSEGALRWKGRILKTKETIERVLRQVETGKHWRYKTNRDDLKRYNGEVKDRISPRYKGWRKEVLERDGYKCRIADNNCGGRLEVHHILSYKEHLELRYQINNGITLCHAHHPRKRVEEKRLAPIFIELVAVSKDNF